MLKRFRSILPIVAILAVIAMPTPAGAVPPWAPAATAAIHPGVMTFTDGAQCTSNFVFYNGSNDVFIGQAAHCAGTGGATETNGCDSGSLPLGTPVEVDGASQPGTLVYSSWLTMQANGETNANACQYNDFALVRLSAADYNKVNPSVPVWGGPVSVGSTTALGDAVYSYGNSSLRLGLAQLSPKTGYSLGAAAGGWTHDVYTLTPGIPGDSGSAFLSSTGAALGTLSTVAIAPFPASNGVGDIGRELNYMLNNGGPNVSLALGTEPFVGGLGGLLP